MFLKIHSLQRLPWQLSGKEFTYQCKRYRFHPWPGKIPHATEQLSLCARTPEPKRFSPVSESPCSMRDASAMRNPHAAMSSSPRSPQLEKSPHTDTHTHKYSLRRANGYKERLHVTTR